MLIKLLNNRIKIIRVLTSLFLLVGIFMSFKLWVSDRMFPLCPISESIPQFPFGLDFAVLILLIVLLLLGTIANRRIIFISILLVMLVLFFQDQMRWQPWVYLYVLMLIPFSFKIEKQNLLSYFQILIIGVYLWGGLHKFSSDFIDNTYYMILIDMFGVTDEQTILSLRPLGYGIPLFETATAVMLLVPKTRLFGIISAIITHVFIFILLFKIDSNTTLYPWNLAMILFAIILFYKNTEPVFVWVKGNIILAMLNLKAVLLGILLPALSLVGLWDHYLSFGLYSGKTNLFYICINNENVSKVDKELHQYFWNPEDLTRGKMISLSHWAADELNVPFYPETRVFKIVAESFCKTKNSDIYIFAEFDRGFKEGDFESFTCAELE